MIQLGLISDESGHRYPDGLFRFGVSRGIQRFELRFLYGKRVPEFTGDETAGLKRLMRAYGVSFSALSPGLFKCSLYDPVMADHAGRLLDRSLELAQELEADKLIVFGVRRCGQDRPQDKERVLHLLGEAAWKAGRRGVTLCLENEPGWWADTTEHVGELLHLLENTGCRLNWDPGNLFAAGVSDCLDGYTRLRNYIGHIHAKDTIRQPDGQYRHRPLGEGSVGWREQLAAFVKDGYDGDISIETHCEPLRENAGKNIAYLRGALGL